MINFDIEMIEPTLSNSPEMSPSSSSEEPSRLMWSPPSPPSLSPSPFFQSPVAGSSKPKEILTGQDMAAELKQWALERNIHLNDLTALLHIEHKHSCFSDIPQDARTVLKIPRTVEIRNMEPGEYAHLGLINQLGPFIDKNEIQGKYHILFHEIEEYIK